MACSIISFCLCFLAEGKALVMPYVIRDLTRAFQWEALLLLNGVDCFYPLCALNRHLLICYDVLDSFILKSCLVDMVLMSTPVQGLPGQ